MRLIPTSLTQKLVDPNDPTGGQTIDALMARQKALQDAAPTAPQQIASPWQGAAFMANSFMNSLQQRQAQEQEASGRKALAQAMAQRNMDTGDLPPEAMATLNELDPEQANRVMADIISRRRQLADQQHADAMTRAGWEHSDTAAATARDAQAALPDSPTGKIMDDYNRGLYGPVGSEEAIRYRDADIRKATTITQPGTKAADLKVKYTQEDEVNSLDNTLTNLSRALELNPKVPVGRVAQTQATLKGNLPEGSPEWLTGTQEAADASKEFWQIMDEQAISRMSDSLKGATTDTELMQFKQILSDPSTSVEVRQRTINRMMQLAKRQRDTAKARLDDINTANGGGTSNDPTQPPAPAPATTPAPSSTTSTTPPPVDLSKIPEGAVLDLKNDPSPEAQAEFEEFFKLPPGTAKRIVGGK